MARVPQTNTNWSCLAGYYYLCLVCVEPSAHSRVLQERRIDFGPQYDHGVHDNTRDWAFDWPDAIIPAVNLLLLMQLTRLYAILAANEMRKW